MKKHDLLLLRPKLIAIYHQSLWAVPYSVFSYVLLKDFLTASVSFLTYVIGFNLIVMLLRVILEILTHYVGGKSVSPGEKREFEEVLEDYRFMLGDCFSNNTLFILEKNFLNLSFLPRAIGDHNYDCLETLVDFEAEKKVAFRDYLNLGKFKFYLVNFLIIFVHLVFLWSQFHWYFNLLLILVFGCILFNKWNEILAYELLVILMDALNSSTSRSETYI